MPYYITRSDGTPLVAIPDMAVNNTATSLRLIGKNAPDFGLALDQNFVYLAQNWASPTAPLNPLQGQIWYDSAAKQLKLYDSATWRSLFSTQGGMSGTGTFRTGQYNAYVELSAGNIVALSTYSTVSVPSSNVSVQGVSHDLAKSFPTGFVPGINLAKIGNAAHFNGTVTSANAFATSRQISVVGSANGNLMFSGQLVANIAVNLSNSYVGNTNVTVAGTWSSVRVNDAGIVVNGGAVRYNDVVGALGYLPYSSDNLSSSNSNLSIVYRDHSGSFAANVMTGTARYAAAFSDPPLLTVSGDMVGSVLFDGSANVAVTTALVTNTGVQSGVYNRITVDDRGLVTAGDMLDIPPVGTMVLYALSGYTPYGWVQCNGQTVTTDAGTFNTPNMSNVSVGGATYIMKVSNMVDLPAGSSLPGSISVTLVPGQVPSVTFSGGAVITYPPLVYSSGFNVQTQTSTVTAPYVVPPVTFGSSILYDSIALALSNGDSNAVMLSQVDIFGDLSQLTVLQVMHNLRQRDLSGLPGRCGKYMLSYSDIADYCGVLGIPVDITYFTIALQDQIAVIKVADISNRLHIAGIIASDANLYGIMYVGYERFVTVIKAPITGTVSQTLQAAGFAATGDSYTDSLSNYAFLYYCAQTIYISKTVVSNNRYVTAIANNFNSATGGDYFQVPPVIVDKPHAGNTSILSTTNTIDGFPTYFGGNVQLNPGYGGGSFVGISQHVNDMYYSNLASSRYNGSGSTSVNVLSNQSGLGGGGTLPSIQPVYNGTVVTTQQAPSILTSATPIQQALPTPPSATPIQLIQPDQQVPPVTVTAAAVSIQGNNYDVASELYKAKVIASVAAALVNFAAQDANSKGIETPASARGPLRAISAEGAQNAALSQMLSAIQQADSSGLAPGQPIGPAVQGGLQIVGGSFGINGPQPVTGQPAVSLPVNAFDPNNLWGGSITFASYNTPQQIEQAINDIGNAAAIAVKAASAAFAKEAEAAALAAADAANQVLTPMGDSTGFTPAEPVTPPSVVNVLDPTAPIGPDSTFGSGVAGPQSGSFAQGSNSGQSLNLQQLQQQDQQLNQTLDTIQNNLDTNNFGSMSTESASTSTDNNN